MKMCDLNMIFSVIILGLFAALALSDQMRTSIMLELTGNVYPEGVYTATIKIGNPPMPYVFSVDSGSSLTWLKCDAPCKSCAPAVHQPFYKPKTENTLKYKDPSCTTLKERLTSKNPEGKCEFKVEYADSTSIFGFLLEDSYTFKLKNGTTVAPRFVIGCGYDQRNPKKWPLPVTDGIFGMGTEQSSIVAQLHKREVIGNVFGHCLSTQGNGYLFMGNNVLPSGIVWAPIKSKSEHYAVGPAEFLYDGRSTRITGLSAQFDSGSSYTYFSSKAYDALHNELTKMMSEKKFILVKESLLSVCWKGPKPYRSINNVKYLFKTLTLSFTQLKNVQFQMSPEAYLIISGDGNVCLGIESSEKAGLGDTNIIGDISMLDKLMIYDNDKKQVGWVAADCTKR